MRKGKTYESLRQKSYQIQSKEQSVPHGFVLGGTEMGLLALQLK